MARLLLGRHPQGAYGLFISKPGVAVESVSPSDPNLHFSTAWSAVISILASGTVGLNSTVTLPAVGFRPYVRIETKVGNTYNLSPPTGRTVSLSSNTTRRYDFTRYMLVYQSDTTFQVQRRNPAVDQLGGDDGIMFRYTALNFAYNS